MKVTLITFDNEGCVKDRGFAKSQGTMGSILQGIPRCKLAKLHDNAARFKKDPEVINLILVGRRNEIHQEETRGEPRSKNDINNSDNNNNGVVGNQTDKLTNDDKELERFFQIQIEAMAHCSPLQLKPHEKLPKVTLTKETEGNLKRVLDRFLTDMTTISEITDKVYAIGKASALNYE